MNSMPPTIVGPGPPSPPPLPATPLTVSYGWLVLNSQMILPSFAAKARRTPSRDPVNTAPAIAVAPAQLPEWQPIACAFPPPPPPRPAGGSGQPAGLGIFVCQTRSPVVTRIAASDPD